MSTLTAIRYHRIKRQASEPISRQLVSDIMEKLQEREPQQPEPPKQLDLAQRIWEARHK